MCKESKTGGDVIKKVESWKELRNEGKERVGSLKCSKGFAIYKLVKKKIQDPKDIRRTERGSNYTDLFSTEERSL